MNRWRRTATEFETRLHLTPKTIRLRGAEAKLFKLSFKRRLCLTQIAGRLLGFFTLFERSQYIEKAPLKEGPEN